MSMIWADAPLAGPRSRRITWTLTFVAFLAYTFIIVTFRLPVATVVAAIAILSLFLQRDALRAPHFLWLYAAWVGWGILGYAVTPYPDQVRASLIEHGKVVLVTLVAVNALRTAPQVRGFMLFLLASYIVFPVRSTLVNYATGYTLSGRAIGPAFYQNPNELAALTILMLGLALALWAGASRRSPLRWIGLVSAALCVVTILLTQSRGAVLALTGMALLTGVALARHRPRVLLGFAAVVGLGLYLAPAGLWERLGGLRNATSVETIGAMDPEGSARERFAVLQTAARIVVDHPLFGVGLGAYTLANADYNPATGRKDTHNTYLNVAAEAGLPGLILFVALVTNVLRSARNARRRARLVSPAQAEMLRWLQYGVIGYLIAGVFDSFSSLTFPFIFLGVIWSASQATDTAGPPASTPDAPLGWPDQITINHRLGGGVS